MKYEKFKIKEFNHWIVYLHSEFYCQYLGSVYIWAKRDEDVDIMEMSAELVSILRDEMNYPASEKSLDALAHVCLNLIKTNAVNGRRRLFNRVKFEPLVFLAKTANSVRNRYTGKEEQSSSFSLNWRRKRWIEKLGK